MSIDLTNSLKLDINKPLVIKDVINSDIDYISQNPLDLTEEERILMNNRYNEGYIVYDNYTKFHYSWNGLDNGWKLLKDNFEEYVEEVIDSLDSYATASSSDGSLTISIRQINGCIDNIDIDYNRGSLTGSGKLVLHNPPLTSDGTNCIWYINYSILEEVNIDKETAVVHLREKSTGKQLLSDVIFNDEISAIELPIMSETHIEENTYTAIIV